MRTLKISIMLLALFIAGAIAPLSSTAGKPYTVKTRDMVQLNKVLRKSIDPPAFKLNDQEEGANVDVLFTMTSDGKIRIIKVTAPTERLEQFVKNELSDITANDLVNPQDLRYQVDIRFFND